MSLENGHKLTHYEILEPIGKGGMGEVYRAKDSKLGRDVAIKVLPDEFAQDEERLRRFQREAKVLASLNHPNIAAIYGLEEAESLRFLVLELVPGETLAERIARGRIPVDEALEIATKIAEALEEAHEQGIVHRDLKPANVKLTEDGKVKVLDFGLAKAFVEDGAEGDAATSMSPTITRDATRVGVILGTASYMSPEQAKGKRVDERTDIFAFGAVVYEMLTGERAFPGEDVSDTLAAVLRAEPDWAALPAGTPPSLSRVVRLCLEKDVRRRVQAVGDVRLAMDGAFDAGGASQEASASLKGSHLSIMSAALAAALLSVVTGVVVWRASSSPEAPRPVVRFSLDSPAELELMEADRLSLLALSPGGSRLVYAASEQLFIRALDDIEATPIRGTAGARSPFFSPDGEWIGFFADRQLRKVPTSGGAPVTLCDAVTPRGVHWGDDGYIVYTEGGVGVFRVHSDGGAPDMLVPNETGRIDSLRSPQLLPGGTVLLVTQRDPGMWQDGRIVARSLETGEERIVVDNGTDARYVPTGHLVYVSDGTLLGAPFDADELELTGGPIALADHVMRGIGRSLAQFAVSDNGVLAYFTEGDRGGRSLVWVDRHGTEEPIGAEPRAYARPRISPDGTRVAVDVYEGDSDIWIWDFSRETLTRFTFDPNLDVNPIWTPDGARIAFSSASDGPLNLYWKAADGAGAVEPLNKSERREYAVAFTPDGTKLLFNTRGVQELGFDISVLTLGGSAEKIVATDFTEIGGEPSPDGRWLAYQSDASGRNEIYVRRFPNVDDGQWLVSSGGGVDAVWSRDGRELFYMAPGARLMAVDIETEPTFAAGNPHELFSGYYAGLPARTYDVAPDGSRFLMLKESADGDATKLIVVLNWTEELKRLVPTP